MHLKLRCLCLLPRGLVKMQTHPESLRCYFLMNSQFTLALLTPGTTGHTCVAGPEDRTLLRGSAGVQ